MSYINKTLLPDEKVIYRSHSHWTIVFRPLFGLILLTSFLLIGGRHTLLIVSFFLY